MGEDGSLLIYAPVTMYVHGGERYLENQAINGLKLWADNFSRLVVLMPEVEAAPPPAYTALSRAGLDPTRVRLEPVPEAYGLKAFLKHLGPVRSRIRRLIEEANYLSFAIGGLIGDWGTVCSIEAMRRKRPFAVWTDRVESEVVRRTAQARPFPSNVRRSVIAAIMAVSERAVIRRSTLGLFHGKETFEAYSPYCRAPHIVHDIHIRKADHIPAAALSAKIADVATAKLSLAYVGRADPMKGPLDWVETLVALDRRGVDFEATWLGEGSELGAMKSRVEEAGLSGKVAFPGFVTDRAVILDHLRRAHVFLFCHLTPESPRCLIEALISGAPIIGYDGAYARDLVQAHGGGRFVPIGDTAGLAEVLFELSGDRAVLADLIGRAAEDGKPFEDVAVFRHRSELIKEGLPFFPTARLQSA